jgi:hypothetical protein
MPAEETIPVEDAVAAYVQQAGYTPSHIPLVLAELNEPGTLPLDLLGEPLPYSIKDGVAVIERRRFDAVMARLRESQRRDSNS